MLGWDLNIWFAIIFGCICLYLIVRIIFKPARLALKVLGKVAIGALVLLLINYSIGLLFGFQIAINLITALAVGFLGVPGILLFLGILVILA